MSAIIMTTTMAMGIVMMMMMMMTMTIKNIMLRVTLNAHNIIAQHVGAVSP